MQQKLSTIFASLTFKIRGRNLKNKVLKRSTLNFPYLLSNLYLSHYPKKLYISYA